MGCFAFLCSLADEWCRRGRTWWRWHQHMLTNYATQSESPKLNFSSSRSHIPVRVGSLCGFVRRWSAFLVLGEWWYPCFIELPPEPQNLCVMAHICEKPFTLAICFFHSLIGAGKTHFESIREWWVVQQLLAISRKCKGRSWKISCSCNLWIIQPKMKWILRQY